MNCRPNDLAEIVGAGLDTFNLLGVRVVVTGMLVVRGIESWRYVSMDGMCLRGITGRAIGSLEDHFLKPIPGVREAEKTPAEDFAHG